MVEFDIRKFFDTVAWDKVVAAVEAHADAGWVVLYVKRWLAAGLRLPDGSTTERVEGTPQVLPCSASESKCWPMQPPERGATPSEGVEGDEWAAYVTLPRTCINWRLGFRQFSFRHITRVPPARHFLGTPEAMKMLCFPGLGVPPSQFRPTVYLTIWR